MSIFSTPGQLDEMRQMLVNYVRLPFSSDSIPGALTESALAHVRGGEVLRTYDFVDVISTETRRGWQVKSTKAGTPVTWKRAKIPNAQEMIAESRKSDAALKALGEAVIRFCNDHALASMEKYNLDEIGYSRLIVHKDGRVTYFEHLLCSQKFPEIFDPNEFTWRWSTPKKTSGKEQLPALHGVKTNTRRKWWAWHGLGENQLHFSGESVWWPATNDPNMFSFHLPPPENKLSYRRFVTLFQGLDF